MPKKDDSASKPPSPEVSQKVKKIVDKHGYCAVDPPKEVPKKSAEVIDELREEYDWYKLQDKDKDAGVQRHGKSSCIEPNPNLIMFAM